MLRWSNYFVNNEVIRFLLRKFHCCSWFITRGALYLMAAARTVNATIFSFLCQCSAGERATRIYSTIALKKTRTRLKSLVGRSNAFSDNLYKHSLNVFLNKSLFVMVVWTFLMLGKLIIISLAQSILIVYYPAKELLNYVERLSNQSIKVPLSSSFQYLCPVTNGRVNKVCMLERKYVASHLNHWTNSWATKHIKIKV